jgi:hypothetical protein
MRDTFATYQFAKTWLHNKQLVVVDSSAWCTGKDCFYVSAQVRFCCMGHLGAAAPERATFANEPVQSLREKTAELVDQVFEARKMPEYDVVVSFLMSEAKEALMGENVKQTQALLTFWRLGSSRRHIAMHCRQFGRFGGRGKTLKPRTPAASLNTANERAAQHRKGCNKYHGINFRLFCLVVLSVVRRCCPHGVPSTIKTHTCCG